MVTRDYIIFFTSKIENKLTYEAKYISSDALQIIPQWGQTVPAAFDYPLQLDKTVTMIIIK